MKKTYLCIVMLLLMISSTIPSIVASNNMIVEETDIGEERTLTEFDASVKLHTLMKYLPIRSHLYSYADEGRAPIPLVFKITNTGDQRWDHYDIFGTIRVEGIRWTGGLFSLQKDEFHFTVDQFFIGPQVSPGQTYTMDYPVGPDVRGFMKIGVEIIAEGNVIAEKSWWILVVPLWRLSE